MSRTLSFAVAVAAAATLAAVARPATVPIPGHGMMGGAFGVFGVVQTSATQAQLAAVQARVDRQLAADGYAGFRVREVMAFARNDYVLVADPHGRPAFELLADPRGRWLVAEPGPNTMWNTRYGMMGGSVGGGGLDLSAGEAKARADAWLARHQRGRVTEDATALPGYYTIDVSAQGRTVGMLSVNRSSGTVWYHTWHGGFLADRDF